MTLEHLLLMMDGDITASIQVFNPVDITELGSYEVVYAVSDSSGNAANQLIRIVSVVDTTAPSIVLTGEPVLTIEAGSVTHRCRCNWI